MQNIKEVIQIMYERTILRNGNTKIQNKSRTRYAIYSRLKKRVTFNCGVNPEAVRQFENKMRLG